MKYIHIIFLLLASNGINAMEAERKSLASFFDVVCIPADFPVELTNKILLDLAQNVHNYVGKEEPFFTPVKEVKYILRTVSILNKEWHNKLDKERNDPVTTRTMIQNIGVTCYPGRVMSFAPMGIIKELCTPGAKKCIALSDKLYDIDLTVDTVEQLYNDGAMLDHYNGMKLNTVLSYWVKRLNAASIDIMRKLLQLGANPDAYYECGDSSPLNNAMYHASLEKNKLLLSYGAKKEWYIALKNPYRRFIDTFIEYSTKDELTDGLIVCINGDFYLPEIMQKLIDKGANPCAALPHIFKNMMMHCVRHVNHDHLIVQKFNFLCDQKAYDATVHIKMQNLQTIFSSLADKLEHNKII